MKYDKRRVYRYPEYVWRYEITWEWTDAIFLVIGLLAWAWSRR